MKADLSTLAAVCVSGPDRQSWLTNMTSQIINGMTPAESKELLVLDANGRIEHAAAVHDDGETTWLVTVRNRVGALAQWLESMKFMLRVEVAARHDIRVIGTVSSDAQTDPLAETARHLPGYLFTWDDPWPGVVEGGTRYFAGSKHPGSDTHFHLHIVEGDGAITDMMSSAGDSDGITPAECLPGTHCALRHGVLLSDGTRTLDPSRLNSTGCAPPSICIKAATAGRNLWHVW